MTEKQDETERLTKEIESLRNEAATRRIQAKQARQKLFAAERVIEAHGIDFDAKSVDIEKINLEEGTGFDYQAPKPKRIETQAKPERGGIPERLTIDDVRKMSQRDIHENYDMVMQAVRKRTKPDGNAYM